MNKKRALWVTLLAGLGATVILVSALNAPRHAASAHADDLAIPVQQNTPAASADLAANCRLGVAAFEDQMQNFNIVSKLGTGWYLDFGTKVTPPGPPQAEYVQMLRIHQGKEMRDGTDICGPRHYTYTISPRLTEGQLGARIDANPGALWVVGNEPDRRNVQDDVCPQQYAEAYHEAYHFIKERDPTAQVAIAGLVEVTPSRLQYLDIVWDTYLDTYGTLMPVDVWTMHIYILSESDDGDAHIALGTDPDLAIPYKFDCSDPTGFCQAEHDDVNYFIEQAEMMRAWMKEKGQQDKPLIMTEYGILKPYNYYGICPDVKTCPSDGSGVPGCLCDENNKTFHPSRVADYLKATFDYLMTATDPQIGYPADDYRLVQQWLWYRLATDGAQDLAHASNLIYTDTYTLTLPGERWQNYAATISPTVNLLALRTTPTADHAADGTSPVTPTLSAIIVNNGNIAVSDTVTVTFYSNEALTDSIGSATFSTLGGCARRQVEITTTWKNLPTGAHAFWVKVDSEETITEPDELDNTAQGLALVNPIEQYLPLVLR